MAESMRIGGFGGIDRGNPLPQRGGCGGGRRRIAGKLAGRRVWLLPSEPPVITLPNTPTGRALYRLITRHAAGAGDAPCIELVADELIRERIDELAGLLAALYEGSAGELPDVYYTLLGWGVSELVARRLAADRWVTQERVDAWIEVLAIGQVQANDAAGYLVAMLQNRIEAPPVDQNIKTRADQWLKDLRSDPERAREVLDRILDRPGK